MQLFMYRKAKVDRPTFARVKHLVITESIITTLMLTPLMSESMEAGYPAILLLFSSRCTCDSVSTATWSATSVAASLAHLTGVMISWNGRLQKAYSSQ
jgi:hypothetical protein